MRWLKMSPAAAAVLAVAACGRTSQTPAPSPASAQHPAGNPAEPLYRELKDWIIGCDNVRACRIKFVRAQGVEHPDLDAYAYGDMSVAREPGPAGQVVVTVSNLDQAGTRGFARPLDVSALAL